MNRIYFDAVADPDKYETIVDMDVDFLFKMTEVEVGQAPHPIFEKWLRLELNKYTYKPNYNLQFAVRWKGTREEWDKKKESKLYDDL